MAKNEKKDYLEIKVTGDMERLQGALEILDDIGLDLGTAVRVFLYKVDEQMGIPFKLGADSEDEYDAGFDDGWEAAISAYGFDDMDDEDDYDWGDPDDEDDLEEIGDLFDAEDLEDEDK